MDENICENIVAPAHGRKRASKSPVVRLHLSLSDSGAPPPQEVIKRVTKGHEVVDVDGFVFKRKRSMPATAPLAAPAVAAASDPSVHPPAPTPPPGAAGAAPATVGLPSPAGAPALVGAPAGAAAAQPQREADLRHVRAQPSARAAEAAAAALEALPAGGAPEAQRLLALCEALAHGQVAAAVAVEGGETGAVAALRAALGTVLAGVRGALADGTLQCAEELPDTAAAAAAAAQAHRAELLARLAALREEEAEWRAVLQKHAAMVGQLSAAAAGAAAAGAAVTAAPSQQGEAAADAAPAAASAADALQPAAPAPADTVDAVQAAAAAPAAPPAAEASAALALRRAQTNAHRTLAIQVEGLCAMVSGVEDLVATAERECGRMQADYHHQKFSMFEHVDSPARLIKEIVRPARPRREYRLEPVSAAAATASSARGTAEAELTPL